MSKSQIYFYAILMAILASCTESSDQKDEYSNNHHIEITSKNPKAIEFFRKAEEFKLNSEHREAKESYLSALRLDPNMVMALIEINETNIPLRSKYRRKAVKNLVNANDFEKIYVAWDTLSNNTLEREKKQELSKKVIELYPNKIDGYLMLGLSSNPYNEKESIDGIKSFEKVLEIDPNNVIANFQIIRYNFGGSQNALKLKNDKEFFNAFDSLAQSTLDRLPNSFRVNLYIGGIYRNSYNFIDESRIEMAKRIYDNCLEIVNSTGSSAKINLIYQIARLNLQMGKTDEAFQMYRSAIDLSDGNNQKINAFFKIFLAYIYEGDYLKAVNEINKFEKNLYNSDFTQEEILKCHVGLNNYKTIIFAHANQKQKALESLDIYKDFSNQLVNFYGFKENIDRQLKSYPGSSILRWKEASPRAQLWHEIWINMLIGNHKEAELFQNKFEDTYGDRQTHWDGILNILQGNTQKGFEILNPMTTAYMQYFKSQALISLGEREKAKAVLDSVRQLPEGSIYNNLIVKRSSDLYKSL